MLNEANLATLLIDLLTPEEELIDLRTAHLRFDMAEVFTGKQFGPAVGDIAGLIVAAAFALLLLAAVNTAIADIVAILFLMSRDGELPDQFQLRPSTSSFTIARGSKLAVAERKKGRGRAETKIAPQLPWFTKQLR
jgi:hypothetical protein